MDTPGRKICVLAAPGDRRDEDIRAIAMETAGHFDHYICKADDHRRGRGDDEVPEMLHAQLIESGVGDGRIEVIPDEARAVDAALNMALEGDLVVIFGDNIQRCWKQVAGFTSEESQSAEERGGKLAPSFAEADPQAFKLNPESELIRDERGVRIARIDEESD